MGCFLLNELGEVLLELYSSEIVLGGDMRLEVNEEKQTAVLKRGESSFSIDFVHKELMLPLKMHRYLFVIKGNNQLYAQSGQLAKVVFVG